MDSQAFWSHWGWPFATALIGFFFTYLVFRQYLQRKKPHQLAWSVGLLFYAVAAFMEAYSEYTQTWDPTVYRVYIVLAASLVGFLGLGSLYLIAKRRVWGHLFLAYNIIMFLIFIYGTFTRPLVREKLVAGITVGGKALGESLSYPRVCSLFLNIPGTFFLLGGAIYSIFLFARRKEYAYRMWANVLIALGTIVIAAAGGMARAGQTVGLYPAEMVGLSFLLWGFLKAGTLKKGARKVLEKRANSG
jgi:hypothetical protein